MPHVPALLSFVLGTCLLAGDPSSPPAGGPAAEGGNLLPDPGFEREAGGAPASATWSRLETRFVIPKGPPASGRASSATAPARRR